MKNKKLTLFIVLGAIILCVVGGIIIKSVVQQQNFKKVSAEVTDYINLCIEEDTASGKLAEYLDPSTVTAEVTDVTWDSIYRKYLVSITFRADSIGRLDDTEKSLASHDLTDLFQERGFEKHAKRYDVSSVGFDKGSDASYSHVTVIIDGETVIDANDERSEREQLLKDYRSDNKDKVTCKSCKNKFSKGSENAKSISRTNMCKNCYGNYKTLSEALDN